MMQVTAAIPKLCTEACSARFLLQYMLVKKTHKTQKSDKMKSCHSILVPRENPGCLMEKGSKEKNKKQVQETRLCREDNKHHTAPAPVQT